MSRNLEKASVLLWLLLSHSNLSVVRRAIRAVDAPVPCGTALRRASLELDGAADAAHSKNLPGLRDALKRAKGLIDLHLCEGAPKCVPVN